MKNPKIPLQTLPCTLTVELGLIGVVYLLFLWYLLVRNLVQASPRQFGMYFFASCHLLSKDTGADDRNDAKRQVGRRRGVMLHPKKAVDMIVWWRRTFWSEGVAGL